MINKKMNILIVGAGKGGAALIDMLSSKGSTHIAGVVDKNEDAPGIVLAKEKGIPVSDDFRDFLSGEGLDQVINVTGDVRVQENIIKECPNGVGVIEGESARFMWDIIEERDKVTEELNKVKEDLETQAWGLKKTSEGVKTLYKELEKKNEALKKLDQLKSDFISTVSHELRTPLTTIRETVSQMVDGILGPVSDDQKEFLGICLEEVSRLRRIIDNLLDMSKIEAGKVELKKEVIDISGVVDTVYSSFRSRAAGKGLELKKDIPDKPLEIYADKDKIIQVITNFAGNAMKFTEKGSITISVQDKENTVECSVKDTGKGISGEDLPGVFDKFRQFGRTEGAGEKGTGLGLSISKGIVEQHKGSIWAESEEGKGSRFVFTLPKSTRTEAVMRDVEDEFEDAKKEGRDISLLVVKIDSGNGKVDPSTGRSVLGAVRKVIRSGDSALMPSDDEIIVIAGASDNEIPQMKGRLMSSVLKKLRESGTVPGLSCGAATYGPRTKGAKDLILKAREDMGKE